MVWSASSLQPARRWDFGSQSFTSSATAGYTKSGAGVLALSGNTFSGGFTLNAGTVIARSTTALGGGTTNVLTLNGGILASNADRSFVNTRFAGGIVLGGNVQLGALAANSALASDTASLTFANNVALGAATRTITIGNNGTDTFNSVISGAAGVGLTVDALSGVTGSVVLGGANTFTGTFTANAGTTSLSVANALSGVSAVNVVSGATLRTSVLGLTTGTIKTTAAVTLNGTLDVSGGNETVASLAGTSTTASLVIGRNTTTSGSFTVGDSTSMTFAGVIKDGLTGSGATAFIKQGNGTLTLSNANTYSGTTTVTAGTLLATNTTGSATGTSAVTVGTGGTIGGTGTIGSNGTTTTIASGGKITGGTDGTVTGNTGAGTIGILNVASALAINGTYVADVSGSNNTSDLLQLSKTDATNGKITLGTTATLTLNGTLPTNPDGSGVYNYVLATYYSLTGNFANFTDPAGYHLVYGANQLELDAIPEPSTWLGGFLLISTLADSQRRSLTRLLSAANVA